MPIANSDSPRAARAAAAEADRERRAAIMALPEAADDFQPLAAALAEAGLSVEAAREAMRAHRAHLAQAEPAAQATDASRDLGESRLAGVGLGGRPRFDTRGRERLAEAMRRTLKARGTEH